MKKTILNCFLFSLFLTTPSWGATSHPLDGLSKDEISRTSSLLRRAGHADKQTLYSLIELVEPHKLVVLNEKKVDRRVLVHYVNKKGFQEALVNLSKGKVEKTATAEGQPMILFAEFLGAMETALASPELQAALEKRDLTPDDVFCLPLTAGNFNEPKEKGKRIMKVPCYINPTGSNFYAKPIENLLVKIDILKKQVLEIVDQGVLPNPKDSWGYTQQEVAKRTSLRPHMNPANLQQEGKPNYAIDGSSLQWDIWKMRFRVDKRPGLVLSNIDVNDQGKWRSILYQAHLSEVFVPYMDLDEGWYWRTYMDSGEYGFGLFLSPLKAGVDCPAYASFLPAVIHDDSGAPLEVPDAICIFERNIGDPAWRHFEIFAQDFENGVFVPTEGRPATELVIRTASEVGNYDYLVDYRFQQDGQIFIKVGATGLDAVKGTSITSMDDEEAQRATKYGTLIAPYLIAPNHSHYFNFKLDFDIDQPKNTAVRLSIVGENAPKKSPRASLWNIKRDIISNESEGTFTLSSQKPSHLMLMNLKEKNSLGHNPGWMVHHLTVGYSAFDFELDLAMKRNAYIKHQIWNTQYDPQQRYAGGKFAFASDGKDTLAKWVQENRNLKNNDIVTWVTAGFHHIPRTEDWPVMSTDWKTIHLMPMNFFEFNPALTIRSE